MLAKSISMVTLGKKLEKKSCEKVTLTVTKKVSNDLRSYLTEFISRFLKC